MMNSKGAKLGIFWRKDVPFIGKSLGFAHLGTAPQKAPYLDLGEDPSQHALGARIDGLCGIGGFSSVEVLEVACP